MPVAVSVDGLHVGRESVEGAGFRRGELVGGVFVDRVALWAGVARDGCVFPVGLEFVAAGGEGQGVHVFNFEAQPALFLVRPWWQAEGCAAIGETDVVVVGEGGEWAGGGGGHVGAALAVGGCSIGGVVGCAGIDGEGNSAGVGGGGKPAGYGGWETGD